MTDFWKWEDTRALPSCTRFFFVKKEGKKVGACAARTRGNSVSDRDFAKRCTGVCVEVLGTMRELPSNTRFFFVKKKE